MTHSNIELEEDWIEAADRMDVSNAEYIRRMVRVGRRQLGYDYTPDETPVTPKTVKFDEEGSDADIVKQFVYRNLSTNAGHTEDELLALIENDIRVAADELADKGEVKYRGSKGGWIKTSDDD